MFHAFCPKGPDYQNPLLGSTLIKVLKRYHFRDSTKFVLYYALQVFLLLTLLF